jgi:PKHD-type hydroxylase
VALHLNKEFYSFDLYGLVEAFQYTVYDDQEGGHYGWHVDLGGNDVEPRKISISLQLTDPERYKGCELEVEAGNGCYVAERARGTLIAFPSYVLHRVTPIESGVRKSLVIWVSGACVPLGAGVFCVVGSSKGLAVIPDIGLRLLLPTPQNPSGAVV